MGSGPKGDDVHYLSESGPQRLGGPWRASEEAKMILKRAGWASEPAGRASEPAGRAPEPAGRAPEPAERALKPAGRVAS